ncbi:hypothetical protein C0W44_17365 [Photobacterium leiognathi subsp. mandapamensis]|nr:hypothetical protein C0W44_17365 [Photobacterium leiognathi subsp. mandapamensis]
MTNEDLSVKALAAVFYELNKKGIDIGSIKQSAKAGVMGTEKYAPASTAHKPKVVDVIEKAYESAQYYIGLDA